jgi:hypothetical protein
MFHPACVIARRTCDPTGRGRICQGVFDGCSIHHHGRRLMECPGVIAASATGDPELFKPMDIFNQLR